MSRDGWSTHGLDRVQIERDRTRDVELSALGYVVLPFTHRGIVRRTAKEAERIQRNVAHWAPHPLGVVPARR